MLTLERGGPQARPVRPRWRQRRDIVGRLLDGVALLAALVLVGLGLLNLQAVGGATTVARQLVSAGIGVLLLAALRQFARFLSALGWVCYGTALLLLLAVVVAGVDVNGARRWLAVGSITVQPSELAKLGVLLVLADVLGSDRAPWRKFVLAIALALAPITLTVLQPDLSTALLLTAVTAAMLVLGRVSVRFLLPLFGGAVIVAPLTLSLLRDYQLARLQAFLSAPRSPGGPGWNILQAHIALASGGSFGIAGEPQHRLLARYLPGRENDLAFASLLEAYGLVAGAVAVLAALLLVWRLALASRGPRTHSGALVAAGLAVLIAVETLVSLGGNLGALPLAGVPYPLLGLGGTAAAVHLAAVGVVLGARRDGARRPLWATPGRRRPRLVRAIALGTAALTATVSAYGWQVQATQGGALREAGQEQMTRCVRIPAPRGVIMDRHGAQLAYDAPEARVEALPGLLRNPRDVARLAALVRQPLGRIRATLAGAGGRLSVRVADVPGGIGRQVEAAAIPGAVVTPAARRVYPNGPLLAPLLGFVGVATPADEARWPGLPSGEYVGRAGIEQQYDALLRGVDGKECVYVDPPGRPVLPAHRVEPVPGANVRLTIDLGLQRRLNRGLAAGLQTSGGDVGGAVLMDARTGEVFAMASLPSYDNNLYGPPLDLGALHHAAKGRGYPTLEHTTQVIAPPGSTFKLVVAAADAAYGVVPSTRVVSTGGSFTYGGHTYRNWRGFGPQNLMQAIAWSNDVYFYKLALRIGPERIHKVATALGVGMRTGIDLPAESDGYVGTPATVHEISGRWYGGSTVILGIGQGYVTTTPLHVARFTSGVATGYMVTPQLGLAFGTSGGPYTPITHPKPYRLPFAGRLGPVQDGMRQAAGYGTAAVLSRLGVPAGGKTGSAQDAASPNGRPDSWFTAVVPVEQPRVVATSFVRGGGRGADTSGPVVAETLRYFLAHQTAILATTSAK